MCKEFWILTYYDLRAGFITHLHSFSTDQLILIAQLHYLFIKEYDFIKFVFINK